MKKRKTPVFNRLTTPFEENCDILKSWDVYPRPQMKRNSFFSLNGYWNIEFEVNNQKYTQDIIVPFPPESRLSGVSEDFSDVTSFKYIKKFNVEAAFLNDKAILHFGAVDQIATVYFNGNEIGCNHGGYLPFEFDVSKYIKCGENVIVVDVVDKLDVNYPYGKQRKKRGGMWYTSISGIWQSVWLESVPDTYIKSIKISSVKNEVIIKIDGGEAKKKINICNEEISFVGDTVKYKVAEPIFWSPESPHLYNFEITSGKDKISSYFALRDISIAEFNGKQYITLNGKPYFFHGLLDQGYFSDGIYLPASPEGYKFDILKMKELGFNMLRKHIKIEPEIFYYYCDLYGMIVFQDFVNSGKYNFVIDTALPTAFLKTGITHYASKKRRKLFESNAIGTVNLLYNHPSVCYYTIFNEGWGQYNADKIYLKMKKQDSSRIWDTTSGWFRYKLSDVESKHIYFKPIKFTKKYKRPLVLSEFGGYSYKVAENSYNLIKNYGYRQCNMQFDFESDLKKLYVEEICEAIKNGLCATVLTQISDVEDETNGLVTYDRRIIKVDKNIMLEISDKIFNIFNSQF